MYPVLQYVPSTADCRQVDNNSLQAAQTAAVLADDVYIGETERGEAQEIFQ